MQKHPQTLVKISADIPEHKRELLRKLAKITGKTQAEIVREAVDTILDLYRFDLESDNAH